METTPNTNSAQQALIDLPADLVQPLDIRAAGGKVVVTISTPRPTDEHSDAAQVSMSGQRAILFAMDLMAAAKAVQ